MTNIRRSKSPFFLGYSEVQYIDVADIFDVHDTNVHGVFYEVVDRVNETFAFHYDKDFD